MLRELKIVNFRNFENFSTKFEDFGNFVIWNNWIWKSNILEAISIISLNSLTWIEFEKLVRKGSDFFYLEWILETWEKLAVFFDKKTKKKKFTINNKTATKKSFSEISFKSVIFSPIMMNIMYLSPNLRRDFLDNILENSFGDYSNALKKYKNILTSRNRLLKNINEWKSSKTEITFWNEEFAKIATEIYKYRFILKDFFEKNIYLLKDCFSWKVEKVSFKYLTKIDLIENSKNIIINYLEKNFERDLILKSTNIWPHRDDFEIQLDDINLVDFASRWEVKSSIIELKNLEIKFIETFSNKKPILIIDDLLSEIDIFHENMLIKRVKNYQSIITSIKLNSNVFSDNIVYL